MAKKALPKWKGFLFLRNKTCVPNGLAGLRNDGW